MIKIIIDEDKVLDLKEKVLRALIIDRAYEGYKYQCTKLHFNDGSQPVEPLSLGEFKKFDFWKIELSFKIYLASIKTNNKNFIKQRLCFKTVVLNTPI